MAHFRQLCCLPLPTEGSGPALLEALHHVVPSLYNRIVWCDQQHQVTEMYCQQPLMYQLAPTFLEEINNRDHEFPGTDWLFGLRPNVGHYLPIVSTARYFRGTYHNEIERPCGGHYFLDMLIGDEQGNMGLILLTREQRAKRFSAKEIDLLNYAVPFVAHAMRAQHQRAGRFSPHGQTALLIADAAGNLVDATALGEQWLSMALHPYASQGRVLAKLRVELPAPLRKLCHAVIELQAGRQAAPPNHVVENGWGRFRFSAALLHGREADGRQRIAIDIHYHEPLEVAMMRVMYESSLSSAQKRLCLTLASADASVSESELAAKLRIGVNTVRDHLRKIYRKLDVHSRDDLLRALSGEPVDRDKGYPLKTRSRRIHRLP